MVINICKVDNLFNIHIMLVQCHVFFLSSFQFDYFWCNHKLNHFYFFGTNFIIFQQKIGKTSFFSSVNSISFANFSEIIAKLFVTKKWKRRRRERAKQYKTGADFLLTKSQPKQKNEIQNSKVEWFWRFLITRNERSGIIKRKLPGFYIWFKNA